MTTIHGPSFGAPDDDGIALERLALEEASSAFAVDLRQPPTGGLPARAAVQPSADHTHMQLAAAADIPDETPSLFAAAATAPAGASAGPELATVSYRTAASPNNPRKHILAWDSDDERRALSLAESPPPRKPRWAPDGGEAVVVGAESARRLRQQYLRLHSLPEWASSPRKRDLAEFRSSDESSDGEETPVLAQPLADFLRDAAPLRQQRPPSPASISQAELVHIQPSPGLPDEHKGDVTSVSFHPGLPMLLSTGADCQLCVHHVDATALPTAHPLLSSVHTRCFVRHAEFSSSGGQRVFFAGGRRFLHEWDLATGLVKQAERMQGQPLEEHSWDRFKLSPCGRYLGLMACARKGVSGVVNVVMVAGMQWIAAVRMESPGGALDFCWWKNSHGLSILGKGGEIGEYSIASRRFLGIWHDEGNSSGSAIAMGGTNGPLIIGGDQYVAIGSSSGRMNIYNRGELLAPYEINQSLIKRHPQPTRSFGPLAGPVSFIAMAEASLAFGSRFQQDCLNLVHLPTMEGYLDWPMPTVPLGRVTAVGFGDNGKLLAAGNDSGKIWLWRLAG